MHKGRRAEIINKYFVCPNGEIVELGTGEVLRFIPLREAPVTTDRATLLQHLDGISFESPGTTPKIIAIGKEDLRILRSIGRLEKFDYGREDYIELITEPNRTLFSKHMSTIMRTLRADSTSTYNTPEYRERHKAALHRYWSLPGTGEKRSRETTLSWITRRERYGPSGFTPEGLEAIRTTPETAAKIWNTRKERYGKTGVKNPEEYRKNLSLAANTQWVLRRKRYGPSGGCVGHPHSEETRKKLREKTRQSWGWRKLKAAFRMLFLLPNTQ